MSLLLRLLRPQLRVPYSEVESINATEIELTQRVTDGKTGGVMLRVYYKSGKIVNIVFPNSQEYQSNIEKLKIP